MFAVCGAVTKARRGSIHSVNIRHDAANALNSEQTWLFSVATLVHRTKPGLAILPPPPSCPNQPKIKIEPKFINEQV